MSSLTKNKPLREKPRRALVLTVIPAEFNAVVSFLSDLREEEHEAGTIYKIGNFENWEVVVVRTIAPGNNVAAVEAERAIARYKPECAMFIGVAGGIKDAQIGDVVASTKVYAYESGKAEENEFFARAEVSQASHNLQQRAAAIQTDARWQNRIKSERASRPKAFLGALAAGEKVVAADEAKVSQFIRRTYSDALAVEMEGRGFLIATHPYQGVSAIVVRGISDVLSGKAESDKQGSQELAAENAAAFAFEMLHSLQPSQIDEQTQTMTNIEDHNLSELVSSIMTDICSDAPIAATMKTVYTKLSTQLTEDDLSWLRSELSGYDYQEGDSSFPSYRWADCDVMAKSTSGAFEQILIMDPKLSAKLSRTPVPCSIHLLEHVIAEGNGLEIAFVADTAARIRDAMARRRVVMFTPTRLVREAALRSIVDGTRARMMDIIRCMQVNSTRSAQKPTVGIAQVMEKFHAMPAVMSGTTITISVKFTERAEQVPSWECDALNLPYGASVKRTFEYADADVALLSIYACNENCHWLFDKSPGELVDVTVSLAFGRGTTNEGSNLIDVKALLLIEAHG